MNSSTISKSDLDHIIIYVKSLQEANNLFSEKLGFQTTPLGTHEALGTQNICMLFEDKSYLELLTCTDEKKAYFLTDFIKQNEGAHFFSLQNPSLNQLSIDLKESGMTIDPPIPGTIAKKNEKAPSVSWYTLSLPQSFLSKNTLFFIEYLDNSERDQYFKKYNTHPNNSKRLLSIWIATKNIDQTEEEFQQLGFKASPQQDSSPLYPFRKRIPLKKGWIDLLNSKNTSEHTADFLNKHHEGIIGITIEVLSIETTKKNIHKDILKDAIESNDEKGASLFIPPNHAKGIWIEFFQEKV